jgi:hypothetical protein
VDWGVVRARLDAIPDDETTRRLLVDRVFELRRVRSHPPTIDRLQTLQRWPEPGTRATDETLHRRMDEALAPALGSWSQSLANTWRLRVDLRRISLDFLEPNSAKWSMIYGVSGCELVFLSGKMST